MNRAIGLVLRKSICILIVTSVPTFCFANESGNEVQSTCWWDFCLSTTTTMGGGVGDPPKLTQN